MEPSTAVGSGDGNMPRNDQILDDEIGQYDDPSDGAEDSEESPLLKYFKDMSIRLSASRIHMEDQMLSLLNPSTSIEQFEKLGEALQHDRELSELVPLRDLNPAFPETLADGQCKVCSETSLSSGYRFNVYTRSAMEGCWRCDVIIRAVLAYALKHNLRLRTIKVNTRGDNQINDITITLATDEQDSAEKRAHQNLRVFVENDDWSLEAPCSKGRKIPDNPRSASTLCLARSWVQSCIQTHSSCQTVTHGAQPRRLIKIENQSGGSHTRLIDTEGHEKYLALSYCWGACQDGKLTNVTAEEYYNQIALDSMPKTLQDAIFLTRYLDFEYLWVDRLCINQDSVQEWQEESAKMGDIYQNSVVTICAYASDDSAEGCFNSRFQIVQRQNGLIGSHVGADGVVFQYLHKDGLEYIVHVSSHFHQMTPFFPDLQPGRRRAWTYQEQMLSNRRLYLLSNELSWECRASSHCECGYTGNEAQGTFLDEESSTGLTQRKTDDESALEVFSRVDPLESLREGWGRIVANYTEKFLSLSKDKLPALSGVAKRFKTDALGRYLAGIWESHLPIALLWSCSQGLMQSPIIIDPQDLPVGCEFYRAPTWSWASYDGVVRDYVIAVFWNYYVEAHVLEALCKPLGLDLTGQVAGGYILMEAPILRFSLEPNPQIDRPNDPTWRERFSLFGAVHIDGFARKYQHLERLRSEYSQAFDKASSLQLYTDTDIFEHLCGNNKGIEFRIIIILGAQSAFAEHLSSGRLQFMRTHPMCTTSDPNHGDFDHDDRINRYGQYSQVVGLIVKASGTEHGAFERCGIFDFDPTMAHLAMQAPGEPFSIYDGILKHTRIEQIKLV